jgi:hypothetical protein
VQTRATTINAIQPSTPEEDAPEPSYAYEAFTAFEETLSGHKYYIPVWASMTTSTQIVMRNMPKSSITIIPEQFANMRKSLVRKPHAVYPDTGLGITPLIWYQGPP